MKKAFRYRILVEWSDEDQTFIARVPALPGCLAHGPSAEKATHEAEVAAGLILDVMREDGKQLPPEDAMADYSGQLRLRLPKSLHEAVSQMATAEGVSINTLMLSRSPPTSRLNLTSERDAPPGRLRLMASATRCW
jgi:antitoxin HicB